MAEPVTGTREALDESQVGAGVRKKFMFVNRKAPYGTIYALIFEGNVQGGNDPNVLRGSTVLLQEYLLR